MQTGTVINKDDLTMGQMDRKIKALEQELVKERKINDENRQEMLALEQDIATVGQNGNNRECDLQNKLDEQYILRRQDKAELQKAQMEIKRLQNVLEQQKTVIRHEKNTTKIMEMENEAMVKMTAMERDNLYKMQQIKALNTSSMT